MRLHLPLVVLNVLVSVCFGLSAVVVHTDLSSDQPAHEHLTRKLSTAAYALTHLEPAAAASSVGQPDALFLLGLTDSALTGALSPARLISLLEGGVRLVVAGESHGPNYANLAAQLGINLASSGEIIVDYFHHDHLSQSSISARVSPVAHFNASEAVSYRGVGHSLHRSPLTFSLLRPHSTAFDPARQEITPSSLSLVSAVQTRKNARLIWSGSSSLFADSAVLSSAANARFVDDALEWLTGQAGTIRIKSVSHSSSLDGQSKAVYKVSSRVRYSLSLETVEEGEWVPYMPEDVQLAVVMLDPHLRVTLTPNRATNSLEASFTLPDRHGVFTLALDHRRPGWSSVQHSSTISVAPTRHDEYSRFILGAAAYYSSAGSVAAATVALAVVWLSHE